SASRALLSAFAAAFFERIRPHTSASHAAPAARPYTQRCDVSSTLVSSPAPPELSTPELPKSGGLMSRPRSPLRRCPCRSPSPFIAMRGQSDGAAIRTAARDASTRAAAALRSGFLSTASVTSAVSSGSPKARIQFGTTVPLRCGPAHLPGIWARADSGMISSPNGGCLIAQPTSVRQAAAPNRTRPFMWSRVLMKLPNEPVQLRRNSQEDFAHDVDHFAVFGVNGASTAGTGSEEKLPVLRRKDEAYRDALFRCGYR